MKKLPSFLINDTSWKNKTLILSTKTFKMMISLSKVFLQTQSFFIVWNQKQIKGKEVTKLQKVEQKCYQEYKSYIKLHIDAVILHHVFIEPFWYQLIVTKKNPWVPVYLQSQLYYSYNISTLPLTLQLCCNPLGILQRVIKNK